HPLVPGRRGADCPRLVGWILPKLGGSSATGKPLSRAFLSRAGSHAQTLHKHSHLATSNSLPCRWTNCEQGYAAPHRCCGWQSTPSRRVFLSSTWVHVRKTPRPWSSTPCGRSWPPFCLPLFTSDGLNVSFSASRGSCWPVA